jgi:hypothetical protein
MFRLAAELPTAALKSLSIPVPSREDVPRSKGPMGTGEIIFTVVLVALTLLALFYLFTLLPGLSATYAWTEGSQSVVRILGIIVVGALVLFGLSRIFEGPERAARRRARRLSRQKGERTNNVEILF